MTYATDLFDVIADANRRRLLDLLKDGERAVGDLVDALGVSQPAVSKQLRVLRQAELVEVRKDAQRRLYRLSAAPLRAVDDWLAPYRRRWENRLDVLDRHLTDMEQEERR